MAGFNIFANLFNKNANGEIPNLWPLQISETEFVRNDLIAVYSRILTDVLERTEGIQDQYLINLFDNCLKSEAQEGLVTLLAKAMVNKDEICLVYDRSSKVLRRATEEEKAQIVEEYKKSAQSSKGIYISFSSFARSDMMKIYSALEYCTAGSLTKSMNLAKAVQIKISDLRGSVSLTDSSKAQEQAVAIANNLKSGRDVALDSKDVIDTAKPDMQAVNSAMDFIDQKKSFYLGLPASWISGLVGKTLSDTGEADSRAVERGLKAYYFSIIKPVVEALFEIKTTFKTDDYRLLQLGLTAAKDLELLGEDMIDAQEKRLLIERLLNLKKKTVKPNQTSKPEEKQQQPPQAK